MDCPPTLYALLYLRSWVWDLCPVFCGRISWLTGTVKSLTNDYLEEEEKSIFNSHVLFYSFILCILMFHLIVFFLWVTHTLGHCHRDIALLIPSLQKGQKHDHRFHLRQCDCQLCAMHVYVAKHKWKAKYVKLLFWLRDTLNIYKTYWIYGLNRKIEYK